MNNPYSQFVSTQSSSCNGVQGCGLPPRGNANTVNYRLSSILSNCSTGQCTANLNDVLSNNSTDTTFSDLVKTPITCALTDCDMAEITNPFSPDVLCMTAHTTYWTQLTQLGGSSNVSFRFPKAGDYLLSVVAVMSTPKVVLTELAVLCGYRIAFTRNVGAVMLSYNRFTINSVDLIKYDYNYIIAYWNFALSESKFKAYRFCVGDVPTLTAPQIALQPYILTVPMPFYFSLTTNNNPCRSFPLVNAGFSQIEVHTQVNLSWADVLVVYKLPVSVEAQCVLLKAYGNLSLNGAALDGLSMGNTFVTAEALGIPPNVVQSMFTSCNVNANAFNVGLGNIGGNVALCIQELASGFISPLNASTANAAISACGVALPSVSSTDSDNFDGVCPCPLLDVAKLPLGCGVIPRTAKNRGRFVPHSLWRDRVKTSGTSCFNIFTDYACLDTKPVVQYAALYGVVTNGLRTALQACTVDYAMMSVQHAAGGANTMPVCGNEFGGVSASGNYNDIQLTFLYAVTAIIYMAENLTSQVFGIWGNYSANILSYSGPDPLVYMQLNYESNTRWSGVPEILTRLEAFTKAERYPRSLFDTRLIGNAWTGQLEGTPNYFDIIDDINGLELISYGLTPFSGCSAGGIVDFGTITVTFRTKLRSVNPNCSYVHSNGGGDGMCGAGVTGQLPFLAELFPFDPSTCLAASFSVRLYALSWQILRFEIGQVGWANL